MTRTIDLSPRHWGRNYHVIQIIDAGQKLKLATWSTPMPSRGDFLILANGNDTTRYLVDQVEPCGDPHDMAICCASFAPR